MKYRNDSLLNRAALLMLAALGTVCTANGALPKASSNSTPAATNSAPIEIPQSTFVIPSNPRQGRDPFFPDSTTVYSIGKPLPRATTNNAPSTSSLVLNGFSGTKEKPLVMISGKTFEEGEEGDVSTVSGKIRIRCVTIAIPDSVVIEVSGERRTLQYRNR